MKHTKINYAAKASLAAVLGANLILGGVTVYGAEKEEQSYTKFNEFEGESIYKEPDQKKLMENLEQISGEEGIGPHSMGTAEEKAVAEFVAEQMKSYSDRFNVRVIEQSIVGTDWESRGVFDLGMIQVEGQRTMYGRYMGPADKTFPEDAKLIDCGKGGEDEIPDTISGNVALIERTGTTRADVDTEVAAIQRVKEKGAAGVVFTSIQDNSYFGGTYEMRLTEEQAVLPTTLLQKEYADILRANMDKIQSISKYRVDKTYTVEGILPAKSGKADSIMYVTSHLDSVVGGPAANDNGSGTTCVLELARLYADVESDVEIRFMCFGGEEYGLIGSRIYAQQLSEEEKANSLCVLNMDEIATTHPDWSRLSFEVVDGKMNLSAALMLNSVGELPALPSETHYRLYQYGSTDHQSFHDVGIDAAGMFRGDTNEYSEPVNHTAADTIDGNIDPDRLVQGASIVSKAVAAVIDNEPDKSIKYHVEDNTDKSVFKIDNIDAITGLSDEVIVEITDPNGSKSTRYLDESKNESEINLYKDGTYNMHFYSKGTGVTNWGNFEEEVYAESGYTIELGSYEVTAKKLVVDRAELINLISEASAKDLSKYQEEGKEKFTKALEEAKKAAAQNQTSQDKLNDAYKNLKDAMDALKPVDQAGTPGIWAEDEKGWRYTLEDGSLVKDNWAEIGGLWYSFDENGYMRTGWLDDGNSGTWYYLNDNGALQTGWVLDGNTWYYCNNSGVLQTGWVWTGNNWYYCNNSGAMQTGWVLAGGLWYYLNDSGAMQTGWILDNNTWYFCNASGAMAVNAWIDGTYYVGSNGAMYTDSRTPDGYYVDKNGAWRP